MTSRPESGAVSQFYDDNTELFLSLGQGTEGTIHRAVWGPGVQTRAQAMAYVDGLIMQRLERWRDPSREAPSSVADLGCGVCASLCRMARRLPITGLGVTISDAQVSLAKSRIDAAGLTASVDCIRADFCALPRDLPQVDLAFSIEAFVHAPSGADYFRECARLIRPGGHLIVCDDFARSAQVRSDPRSGRWVERFRRGWVAPNVETQDEAKALAAAAGFTHVETLDLTPHLEIRRLRDYAAGALMRGLGWLPVKNNYWSMLYGGHALQIGLKRGFIQHLFMVWQRN
jgi:SAM-dependent methyltransferase